MAEAVGFNVGRYLGEGHAIQAKGVKLVESWMFEQVRLILYPATSDSEKISFDHINRNC